MGWVRLGSLAMALAIALGAFGAHALKGALSEEARGWFQTAVLYHLVHGLALLAVGWLAVVKGGPQVGQAGACFAAGLVLFCGSLYVMSVTGARWLGAVTPLGGLAFLAGWVLLALSARS